MPIGAVLLFLGIPALNGLGRLYGRFAQLLLGTNADPALTAQVTELRGSRARVIAAADAERRRLERDLHDGAQQRLVALALTLRMAEQRAAETGDDGTGDLVRRAGEEARLALEELRDLARGIHPAILTNRGLAAALDDLASRAAVPVSILARPDERLPEQVEAAAYFIVSESLANVAKHARATGAWVRVGGGRRRAGRRGARRRCGRYTSRLGLRAAGTRGPGGRPGRLARDRRRRPGPGRGCSPRIPALGHRHR